MGTRLGILVSRAAVTKDYKLGGLKEYTFITIHPDSQRITWVTMGQGPGWQGWFSRAVRRICLLALLSS